MRTVHLIYPHAERISCPDAIGRNLARRLRERYEVHLHDWDDTEVIDPQEGDVLIGHPHPSPLSIFRRSILRKGWSRRVILAPYNHGDLRQSAWLDKVVARSDLYLAITGEHWFASAPASPFKHWVPKMVHMDLAVDRADFPPIKPRFNPPGQRRFLYIGHSTWTKNIAYLGSLARTTLPGTFAWMGTGDPIPSVSALGLRDFRDASARSIVSQHDFLISVGRADANPAAVLEAMAWGLVPVCSTQSSHAALPGIVTLSLDDEREAARTLVRLQETTESDLRKMQTDNWDVLDSRFTWDQFAQRVVDSVESRKSPPLLRANPQDRRKIATARLASPYAPWRPRALSSQIKKALRRPGPR